MQNNTPFSRDPTPNLTRTILSVVKEGQAYSGDPPYSGVERRAKSGPNQRADPSDRRPTGSAETEYNYFKGEYRPRGEQDRYYAKQRAEAKAKAKKTTTVKEERGGSPEDGNTGYGLPRKNSRFYPAKNKRPTGPGTEYHMETLLKRYEAKKAAEKLSALKQNRLDSKSVKEEREYTELLETIIVAIANELNISPQTLIEEFSEQELSEGLRKKIMHGLKVATTAAAILGGGVAGGLGMAKMRNDRLKNESPARQVERQKREKEAENNWRKATAHQAVPGVDNSSWIN